jgi:hypothetical protein
MPNPSDIRDLAPNQPRLSPADENALRAAVRRLLRLQFDPSHFTVQGNTVSLASRPRGVGEGRAVLPPWWPTPTLVLTDAEGDPLAEPYFSVEIKPSTLNNIIPRLTWADPDTVIGNPTGEGNLQVDPETAGIFYLAAAFTGGIINEVEIKSATGFDPPADTLDTNDDSGIMHIVTHVYDAGLEKMYIRPMYFGGIQAILCDEQWRWG